MTPLGPAFAVVVGSRRPDYRPPAPTEADCPICGNERRVFCARTLTAAPCQCAAAYAAAAQAAALLPYSNLAERSDITFAYLNPAGPHTGAGEAYAAAYREAQKYAAAPAGMFTIAGPSNTGKTALAIAIGNAALRRGYPALWIRSGDIIRALRRESTPDADPTAQAYRRQRVLLIDDIPATPGTQWEKEQLLLFLSERDDARRPTVCVLRGAPEQADADIAAKICRQDTEHQTYVLESNDVRRQAQRPPPFPISEAMTFATFQTGAAPDGRLSYAKETAAAWAQKPRGWLCLAGSTGTGKTHLALAVAKVGTRQGDTVYFTTAADLIAELRAATGAMRSSDPLEPAMTAGILVLDDYGAERNTPFADEQLTRLLGHRYDRRLPTIITTNLTPDEMTATRPRMASRLRDQAVTTLLHMTGHDYRTGI